MDRFGVDPSNSFWEGWNMMKLFGTGMCRALRDSRVLRWKIKLEDEFNSRFRSGSGPGPGMVDPLILRVIGSLPVAGRQVIVTVDIVFVFCGVSGG